MNQWCELRLRGITVQIKSKWEIVLEKLRISCMSSSLRWQSNQMRWDDDITNLISNQIFLLDLRFDSDEGRLHQIRDHLGEFKWFDRIKCKTIIVWKQNMSSSDSPSGKEERRPNLCRTAAIIVDQLDIQLYAGGGGATVQILSICWRCPWVTWNTPRGS